MQGGTTKEGIHIGAMSGTLYLVQRAYVGTEIRDGVLHFAPGLRDRLDGLSFPMRFRGMPIRVTLADDELTVAAAGEGASRPIRISVGGEVHELSPGDRHTFTLAPRTAVHPR